MCLLNTIIKKSTNDKTIEFKSRSVDNTLELVPLIDTYIYSYTVCVV